MEWINFAVTFLFIYVIECSAMSSDELQDFTKYLAKTSYLDQTIKKGADAVDDYDEDELISDHAWEESGKFEGDLVLNERQRRQIVEDVAEGLSRNGLRDSTKKWPNNEVIYYIQKEHFTSDQVQAIRDGIEDLTGSSCVKFRPYKKGDRDAVVIQGSRRGCFSQVGYQSGYQVLNLSGRHPVGRGCFRHGTVVHELLHTLGFYHMQSSPDRDDYIKVHWENIIEQARHNFRKYNTFSVSNFGVEYDYDSVLHYSRRAFSANGQDTLVPSKSGVEIGQRVGASDRDIQKLNKMYCDADSNNFDETTTHKTNIKKKKPKTKLFEGNGIGYHQGKTVVIKLPTAETYQLPDMPSYHVFDYFSKAPQAVSPTLIQEYANGKKIEISYKPHAPLNINENRKSAESDTYLNKKTKGSNINPENVNYNNIEIIIQKPTTSSNKGNVDNTKDKDSESSLVLSSKYSSEKLDQDLNDAFDRLGKIIKNHVYPSQTPNFGIYKVKSDYNIPDYEIQENHENKYENPNSAISSVSNSKEKHDYNEPEKKSEVELLQEVDYGIQKERENEYKNLNIIVSSYPSSNEEHDYNKRDKKSEIELLQKEDYEIKQKHENVHRNLNHITSDSNSSKEHGNNKRDKKSETELLQKEDYEIQEKIESEHKNPNFSVTSDSVSNEKHDYVKPDKKSETNLSQKDDYEINENHENEYKSPYLAFFSDSDPNKGYDYNRPNEPSEINSLHPIDYEIQEKVDKKYRSPYFAVSSVSNSNEERDYIKPGKKSEINLLHRDDYEIQEKHGNEFKRPYLEVSSDSNEEYDAKEYFPYKKYLYPLKNGYNTNGEQIVENISPQNYDEKRFKTELPNDKEYEHDDTFDSESKVVHHLDKQSKQQLNKKNKAPNQTFTTISKIERYVFSKETTKQDDEVSTSSMKPMVYKIVQMESTKSNKKNNMRKKPATYNTRNFRGYDDFGHNMKDHLGSSLNAYSTFNNYDSPYASHYRYHDLPYNNHHSSMSDDDDMYSFGRMSYPNYDISPGTMNYYNKFYLPADW